MTMLQGKFGRFFFPFLSYRKSYRTFAINFNLYHEIEEDYGFQSIDKLLKCLLCVRLVCRLGMRDLRDAIE
jgi:hypothetical protein